MDELSLFKAIESDNIEEFKKAFSNVEEINKYRFSLKDDSIPSVLQNSPFIIHVAAYSGSMEILNYILGLDADTKCVDDYKRDVSHFAVAGSHVFVIKVLSDHGVKFDDSIILAAGIGDVYIFKYLVNSLKVDTTKRDFFGSTILHAAAIGGNRQIADLALSLGTVDINSKDNKGNTPLHTAAIHGNLYMVKKLCTVDGIDLNATNDENKTVLHYAAAKRNSDILSELVKKYVALESSPSWDFLTLDLILIEPDIENVGFAKEISNDAPDINIADALGYTPFLTAVKAGGNDVINKFLEISQTDLMAKDLNGFNCFHIAIQKNRKEIVKTLLCRDDIDVNDKDNEGRTPLFYSCEKENSEIAKILVDNSRVNVNLANNKKQTPLHIAAIDGNKAILICLLSSPNIKTDVEDQNHSTALKYLKEGGNEELIDEFIEKTEPVVTTNSLIDAAKRGDAKECEYLIFTEGHDVNLHDTDGWTALHYACRSSHIECVKLLLDANDINVNAVNNQGFTPMFLTLDPRIRDLLIAKGGRE